MLVPRPRRRPPVGVVAAAVLALASGGVAAQAVAAPGRGGPAKVALDGCGGVRTLAAARDLGPGRAPVVVGDSVLLGAMPQASRSGYTVNAHGCRQIGEATSVVRSLEAAGRLPRLVVVQIGANGTVTVASIRRLLRIVGPGRTLALMTARSAFGEDNESSRNIRKAVRLFPTRTALVEWQRLSQPHEDWFQPDGIHLTDTGASEFGARLRRLYRNVRRATDPAVPVERRRLPVVIGV